MPFETRRQSAHFPYEVDDKKFQVKLLAEPESETSFMSQGSPRITNFKDKRLRAHNSYRYGFIPLNSARTKLDIIDDEKRMSLHSPIMLGKNDDSSDEEDIKFKSESKKLTKSLCDLTISQSNSSTLS
ncbi:hypothetical protein Ciccas_006798 [Cichlidogyrus casuarinus]|uniref:Uncharacterized protein n=1 Tax=Cichlidogyrus casuarinus TaxID=1844966 RepID=A0ABD2Q4Q3_9PLAT